MNLLTSFPFTFKLSVPGLINPFSSLSPPSPTTASAPPPPATRVVEPTPERRSRPLTRPTRPLPMSIPGSSSVSGSGFLRRPTRPAFSPSPSPSPSTSLSRTHGFGHLTPRINLSHSPSPAPLSRKRGWEPSYSPPSESQATLTYSTGYLKVPDRMETVDAVDHDQLEEPDLPPAKRRRGLAGSIVSTAWNAALIGTAVGLTVFRLWRNRGKPSEDETAVHNSTATTIDNSMMLDVPSEPSSPPPPYNQEWTSVDYPTPHITPRAREKAKQRGTPRSAARKTPSRAYASAGKRERKGAPLARAQPRPAAQPEFDFEFGRGSAAATRGGQDVFRFGQDAGPAVSGVDDGDDQMDWIGGRLAELIEEGKKALGKEVVVMSDAKEDEVDDGSPAWVDESDEEKLNGTGLKRKGSRRGSLRERRNTVTGSPNAVPTTPRRTHSRGISYESGLGMSPGGSVKEDSSAWESPEMREMMERARAKMMAARSGTR